jgi:hypothetical protein
MTDAAPSIVSPPPAAETAAGAGTQPEGTGQPDKDPGFIEKIRRLSAGAVDQHLAETPRRRGQRGPDRGPRKPRVPLAPLDPGADTAPLAEDTADPLESPLPDEPAFDQENAEALVEIGIGLLNDGAAAIVRAIAKRETGDDLLAEAAAKEIRMSEKIEACISAGALQCAKKYAVRLEYAPEIMLFGGLIVWGGQVRLSINALKSKGAEIRGREEKKNAGAPAWPAPAPAAAAA